MKAYEYFVFSLRYHSYSYKMLSFTPSVMWALTDGEIKKMRLFTWKIMTFFK